MQRVLGNVSALQFVTVYSELGGHATPSAPFPSLVRNLVLDAGRRVQFRPRLSLLRFAMAALGTFIWRLRVERRPSATGQELPLIDNP
jgi:hypothetical protein